MISRNLLQKTMFKSSIKSIFILSLFLGICSQAFAIVPNARTVPANRVTFTSATLNALVNAQSLSTTIKFEYGLTTSYGDSVVLPAALLGTSDSFRNIKITGLIPHRTYHYRVVARNASGTTNGYDLTFISGGASSSFSGRGPTSIIVDSLGYVYTFGANRFGELGNGALAGTNSWIPVRVLKGAYPGTTYLGDNPANPIIAVEQGTEVCLALAANGTVYSFGYNGEGQLGNGALVNSNVPVRVVKGAYVGTTFLGDNVLNPVIAIASGYDHSLALTADGSVYSFGGNTDGQMGTGGGNSSVPVRVVAGTYPGSPFLGGNKTNPIIAIFGGHAHSLALAANGSLYSFGRNSEGQLGDGTFLPKITPVRVVKGSYTGTSFLGDNSANPIISISTHGYSCLALALDGSLFSFGSNTYGQLGDGTFAPKSTPVRVLKGAYTGTTFLGDNITNPIRSIAAGPYHSVVLTENGTLYSFGGNASGQLGNGTVTTSSIPVRVLKGAYIGTTFLGDNPVNRIVSIITSAEGTGGTVGTGHNIAIAEDGFLYSYGYNVSGQLGDSTATNRLIPVRVLNYGLSGFLNILEVGAPFLKTVPANLVTYTSARLNALANTNGYATKVSFEYGLTTAYGSEVFVPDSLRGLNDSFKFAMITGLLPHKTYHFRVKAVNSKGTKYGADRTFITTAATTAHSNSGEHTIILDSTGIVYTFGRNTSGQLGDGTLISKSIPVKVLKGAYPGTTFLGDNPANPIIAVASGNMHNLALAKDGTVYSFGLNSTGQLGNGTLVNQSIPVRVLKGLYVGTTFLGDNPANPIISITTGLSHSMALAKDGTMYTFGDNSIGQLGNGTIANASTPIRVLKGAYTGASFLGDNVGNPIIKIAGGAFHTMALVADGRVFTFGYNPDGQLGDGSALFKTTPVIVLKGAYVGQTHLGDYNANPIVSISGGYQHSMALAADGTIYNFGGNPNGQLGNGTVTSSLTPVRAIKGAYTGATFLGDNIANPIVDITSGHYHSLALGSNGTIYSFGSNNRGQLGDNSLIDKSSPVRTLEGKYNGTTFIGDKSSNPVVSISAGQQHTIATTADGYLYTHGMNNYGQLGLNTIIDAPQPFIVSGVGNVGNLNVLGNVKAPTARTVPANRITYTSAILNSVVNANIQATTVQFEYGLTNAYGSIVTSPGLLTGDEDSFRKATITGLTPHKTYYYRVRAINGVDTTFGANMTFISGGASTRYQGFGDHAIVVDSQGIVYTYGSCTYGQLGDGTTVPKNKPIKVLKGAYPGTNYLGDNPSNPIIAVSIGSFNSLALAADGSVYSFGENGYGQNGDGTGIQRVTPVRVLKGAYTGTTFLGDNPANPVIGISTGGVHHMVLCADGTVFSFGGNFNGQLGDGTLSNRALPVRVLKGLYSGASFMGDNPSNPIVKIACGIYHSLVLAANGQVYTFGTNTNGQLGDNTAVNRLTAVAMLKGSYNGTTYIGDSIANPIIAISGGNAFSSVIAADGRVYSSGSNSYGQLGDGTFTQRLTPVSMLKGSQYAGTTFLGDNTLNPMISVSSGSFHNLFLSSDGLIYSIGYNGQGQLGIGNFSNQSLPVKVLKGAYSGTSHLGDNSNNPMVSVSAGQLYSFGIGKDGYLLAFGNNIFGQLGDNTTTQRNAPVFVHGVGDTGYLNVLKNQRVPTLKAVPATKVTFTSATLNGIVNPNVLATTVSFEYGLTLAYGTTVNVPGTILFDADSFRKANISGLIPHRTYNYRIRATNAAGTSFGPNRTFITGGQSNIAANAANHTLVLDSNGIVYASGYNAFGQLGDGTTTDKNVPIRVLKGSYNGTTYLGDNPANPIIQVASGESFSMALAADGSLYTFGRNAFGQLGVGSLINSSAPIRVVKGAYPGTTFLGDLPSNMILAISAGGNSSAALMSNGTVYTWGMNSSGQLGDGSLVNRTTPICVLEGAYNGNTFIGDNPTNPMVQLSQGLSHLSLLAADGTIFTCGQNTNGQLGIGNNTNQSLVQKVLKGFYVGNTFLGDNLNNPIVEIKAGLRFNVALDQNGMVYTFGENVDGQLGDNTSIDKNTPVRVLRGAYAGTTFLGDNLSNPIVSISAGFFHTSALGANGTLYTFGNNTYGQLGDGSVLNRLTPVRVLKGAYSGTIFLGDNAVNPIVLTGAKGYNTVNIAADGYLFSFGQNTLGQLGDNSLLNKTSPVQMPGVALMGNLNVLTASLAPKSQTAIATRITFTSANLNGIVNANNLNTTVSFEYGLTTAYGTTIAVPGLRTGDKDTFISIKISGLIPHRIYHFRIKSTNADGTNNGRDMQFMSGGSSSRFANGNTHSILVDSTGIVYTFGRNQVGQLGDGSTTNRNIPIRVLKGAYSGTTYLGDNPANPIIAVSANNDNSIALAADGTVYTFGLNANGQMGIGNTTDQSLPVKMLKGAYAGTTYLGDNPSNPVIAANAGIAYTTVLTADGTVFTCGLNSLGQLGDGTNTQQLTPVKALKGLYVGTTYLGDNKGNPIVAIASGGDHNLALAADGRLFSFGKNQFGSLGDNTTTNRNTPVGVLKGVYIGLSHLGDNFANPIVAISSANQYSATLAADGTMYTFGDNFFGNLGDGTTVGKLTPVRTIKGAYPGTTFLGDSLTNPIIAISSYLSFTSAISANGLVYSFGYNNFGQLGDNTVIQRNSPVVVLKGAYSGTANLGDAVGNPIVSVSSSQYSSMAIAADGYVYTIGLNNYGQLGDNTNIDKLVPTIASGVDTVDYINVLLNYKAPTVRTVSANRITFTSATLNGLVDANVLRTQVWFEYGLTTSYGTTVSIPGYIFGDVDSFRKVNITGLLPHKTYHFRVKATNAKGTTYGNDLWFTTGSLSSSSSGRGTHTLVLDSLGLVYSFGRNDLGQLGDGTTISRTKPVRVLKGAYAGTTYLGDNPLNPIIAVSTGAMTSLALAADGTLYSFGYNNFGQLGDNTTANKSIPVKVLKGMYAGTTYLGDNPSNPIIMVGSGMRHCLALASDGTVYSFGDNTNSQLGDNSFIVKITPVRVVKGAYIGTTYAGDAPNNPIISVFAGSSHSQFLTANGLVYSFGSNSIGGQLGDGTAFGRSSPVNVIKGTYSGTNYLGDNPLNPIIAISSHGYSSLALALDGSLFSFGQNIFGQLGDNTLVDKSSPVRVLKGAYIGTTYLGDNPANKIQSIYSGVASSSALMNDGTLYSFGGNGTGQLGDGTFVNRLLPIHMLKGAYNGNTYLGDNPSNPIIGAITGGEYITTPNLSQNVTIAADGYVYSMGWNPQGQLGDNTLINRTLPVRTLNVGMIDFLNVLDRGAPKCFTSMANQITYTSARLNAIVNAYTFNTTVSFEYGLTTSYGSEITIPGVLTRGEDSFRTAVIAGLTPHKTYHYRVKAVNAKGTSYGEDMTFITSAATTAYASSGQHTLVVDSNGIVYGFGRNTEGQLGDGTIINKSLPVKVLKGAYIGTTYLGDNPANPILSVATGEYHSLALAADGSVYSFGYNVYGQLGDNTNVNKSLPVRVLKGAYVGTTNLGDNLNNPIQSVLTGWGYSMALAKDGTIYTFGDNTYGQLGNGTVTASLVPVRAIKGAYAGNTFLGDNPMNPIVKISGGVDHAMALAADGTVYTYGRNSEGQLGNGAFVNATSPIRVLKGLYTGTTFLGDNLANPIMAISAGRYHNLALAANGSVFSFGLNTFGQLGDGTVTQRTTPVAVLKGLYAGTTNLGDNIANPIVSIASGWYHSISLAADGTVYTFGYNLDGELGDNTNVNRTTPIRALKGAYGGTTFLGDKLNNPIVMIGAGEGHSIVTDAKGYLYSFGWNPYGQLGDNSVVSRLNPVIVGGVGNVGNLNVLENYEAPIVRTVPANRITYTGATLNALVNASVLPTTVSFEYGLTTAYGNIVNVPGVVVGDADSFRKAAITGLTPHKTYHYRVRAINSADTSYGMDMTFISGGASSRYASFGQHAIVVDSQGIVYTYGLNSTGQLGDGTFIQKNIPIKVLKGAYAGTTYLGDNPANPIIAVAQGFQHSLALAADGSVYAFGFNNFGQIGDGTTIQRTTPVRVLKGAYTGTTFIGDNAANPIIGISCGIYYSIAHAADGSVFTFGYNGNGQLGDGTTLQRITPIKVLKGLYPGSTNLGDNPSNPIVKISGGSFHSMALSANGQVYTFGYNNAGQLGNNTLTNSTSPVAVLKGLYTGTTFLGDSLENPIIALAGGFIHSAAIAADGTIYTFGNNSNGQLGDNTTTQRIVPVKAVKGATYVGTAYLGDNPLNPVVGISIGQSHNIALLADGTTYGFGNNANGQLGLGNTVNQSQPSKILKGAYSGTTYLGDNLNNSIVSVSAGENHSFAIAADGYILSFGINTYGQLGDNTVTQRTTPVFVHGVGDTGYLNVLKNTKVPTIRTVPATRVTFTSATLNSVVNPNVLPTSISFEYGLTTSYGTTINIPGLLLGDADSFRKVNITGLIPHRTYYYRVKATNAMGTTNGANMTFITGGNSSAFSNEASHSIILDSSGIVYAYGRNAEGQLGDGTNTQRIVPVKVLKGAYNGTTYLGDNPSNPIIMVRQSELHSVALAADGSVYTFGYNVEGQLGDGTNVNRTLPVKAIKGAYNGTNFLGDNLSNPIISIFAYTRHTMALAADGRVYTFGINPLGGLGDNTTISRNAPVSVLKGQYNGTTYLGDNPANPIVYISSGRYHSYAIAADGIVYGFGSNTNGQLGDGTTIARWVPNKVLKGAYTGANFLGDNPSNPMISVSGGAFFSSALGADGIVYTFGANLQGQLGDGTFTPRLTPVKAIKGLYAGTAFLGDNPLNRITSLTCGRAFTLALGQDGQIYAFGGNGSNQLGDGTIVNKNTSVKVLKGAYGGAIYLGDQIANPVIGIASGTTSSIAITQDGYVFGFGLNDNGQIGDNSLVQQVSPVFAHGVGDTSYLNVLRNFRAPSVRTVPANRITYTSASLNGLIDANVLSSTVSFEYGLTTAYGNVVQVPGVVIGDADSFRTARITGLTPHKTYHFRVRAINQVDTTFGADMTFISGGASSAYSSMGEHTIIVDSNGIVYTYGRNTNGELGDGTTIAKNIPVRVLKGAYPGMKYLGDNPANPIIAVASGWYHNLALAADGTLYAFGLNGNGQLGNGTTIQQNIPVRVVKGSYTGTTYLGDNPQNPIVSINCGVYFSNALAADGTVFSFGENIYGQLGDGTTIQRTTPVKALKGSYSGASFLGDNPSNPIIGLSAGVSHAVAFAANGTVYSVGYNGYGQLGDNTTTNRLTPVTALKGTYSGNIFLGDSIDNPIIAVSGSYYHSLALTAKGSVYAIGGNNMGQLGDGTTINKSTPVQAIKGVYSGTTYLGDNPTNRIVAISSGYWNSMCLSENGLIYSFGYNNQGQLGDGTTLNKTSPVLALKGAYPGTSSIGDNPANPIVSISSGFDHTAAIAADGYVFGFGSGNNGELGDNTTIQRTTPVQTRGVGLIGNLNVLMNSLAPVVKTVPANRITYTGATLNAIVNAMTRSTTVSFEYGLTTAYGNTITLPSLLTGAEDSFRKATITGLTPHKTYHFRVKAVNNTGTSYGRDMTFISGGASSRYQSIGMHSTIVDSQGIVYTYGQNGSGELGDGTFTSKSIPVRVLKGAYPGTTYLGDNPANPIISVAQGYLHTLALAADGTVYSFGDNGYLQLGDGIGATRNIPVRVVKGAYPGTTFLGDNPANPIIGISCGLWHSMALTANGSVYTFGYNSDGELGDNTTVPRSTPVRVVKGLYPGTSFIGDDPSNPIVQISGGLFHSLVLTAKGQLYSFGQNSNGQLGDNTTFSRISPVAVLKGLYTGTAFLGDNPLNPIIGMTGSYFHSAALAYDGTLYTTGGNSFGELGNGTNTTSLTPVRTLKGAFYTGTTYLGDNPSNPIVRVSSGQTHNIVLMADGTTYSFGNNGNGQLGNGTNTNQNLPIKILKGAYVGSTYFGDLASNPIVSVSAGEFFSSGIAADGFVYSFGLNSFGQLGDNTAISRFTPIQTLGVNNRGNLNVLINSLKPKMTAVPANNITYTSANLNALVNPNGLTTTIVFEYGLTTAYGDTISVPGTSTGIVNVFKRAKVTGLTPHKTYHYRVKAVNAEGTNYSPDRTFITGGTSSSYASSANHTIIVDSNGIVYAFGTNTFGQLGDSTTVDKRKAVKVKMGEYVGSTYLGDNPVNPIIAVSAGENQSMALAADGTVYAFGLNTYGQLGDNSTTNRSAPVRVLKGAYTGTTYLGDNVANPILSISCGVSHSMALAADGTVFTFGYNSSGELGDGTLTQRITPVRTVKGVLYAGTTNLGDNPSNPIVSIAASKYYSLTLAADGTIYGYGLNSNGQLGDNTVTFKITPMRVLKGNYIGTNFLGDYYANPIISITANENRSAALAADGTIYAFGYNANGQLGDNTTTLRLTPVRVLKGLYSGNTYLGDSSVNPIVAISMGTLHSSALAADGKMYTWGANFFGQLGEGTATPRLTPVRVLKGSYLGTIFLGDDVANPIVSIAGAGNHNTAITKDGFVYSFGFNNAGQLGDSSLSNRATPVQVRGTNAVGNLNVLFNSIEAGITALPANRITYTSAYLNGLVNPNNLNTTTEFEYGLTTSYGEIAPIGGSLNGIVPQRISAPLCNLIPGKTYHFRVKAVNGEGTVYGPDRSFIAGGTANSYSSQGTHNVFVANDGIVYALGANGNGQLGDGTTISKSSPIKVLKGAYNGTTYLGDNPANPIVAVGAGTNHSIALAKDGTVFTFGGNNFGALGDSSFVSSSSPVKVLKGVYSGAAYLGDNPTNPIVSVSAGSGYSAALALDGSIYAFGVNNYGNLGDSTTVNKTTPVRAIKGMYAGTAYLGDNPSNPMIDVVAAGDYTAALAADGTVYSFGRNSVGNLGDNTLVQRFAPVRALKGAYTGTTHLGDNPSNPIISIACGFGHTMALSSNGSVYTIGQNTAGQLGNNSLVNASIPVRVLKGAYTGTTNLGDQVANPIVSISAGAFHSLALGSNGTVYTFGNNFPGKLGDSTTLNRLTPVRALRGDYTGTQFIGDNAVNPIISMHGGFAHSTFIGLDGKVFSTGDNGSGVLGDNTITSRVVPVQTKDIGGTGSLDLILCGTYSSIPTALSTTFVSSNSNTDAAGWRHFCTVDNQLLLSLNIGTTGAVISDDSVRLKTAATRTMSSLLFGGMITNVNGYAIFERRWDVTATTQPTAAVGVRYYFTPKEFSDLVVDLANLPSPSTFTNVNQLTMYKAVSGAPFADPHTVPGFLMKNATYGNHVRWKYAPHGSCNHSAQYEVFTFSGGGGGGGGGGDTTSALLPVELLSFKGQWSEDDAILTWVTASERNSDRFEVERSADGINFTKVGTVKSKGNSTEVLTYMFNDVDAGQAKVDGYYYRLKQIDFDGAFEYAQIIYLSIDKKPIDAKVIVFPNPFVSEVHVVMPTSSNSDVQIQIAGMQGSMIINYMDKVDRDRRVKINTELLPAGVFILNVTQDGITSSHKIIKE